MPTVGDCHKSAIIPTEMVYTSGLTPQDSKLLFIIFRELSSEVGLSLLTPLDRE